jgi:hypothetical protein
VSVAIVTLDEVVRASDVWVTDQLFSALGTVELHGNIHLLLGLVLRRTRSLL